MRFSIQNKKVYAWIKKVKLNLNLRNQPDSERFYINTFCVIDSEIGMINLILDSLYLQLTDRTQSGNKDEISCRTFRDQVYYFKNNPKLNY